MKEINLFDIHSHVNFSAFDKDRTEVIERSLNAGIGMINVGTKFETSRLAVEIAEQYEGVYAIVGLHPIHTVPSFHDADELGEGAKAFETKGEAFDDEKFKTIITGKVVGVGETGLDYFRNNADSKALQAKAFLAQIEFAITHNLPLMLHVRASEGSMDAYYDVYDILMSYRSQFERDLIANLHFFAGDTEIAKKFLDLGCTISFTGVITFARQYEKLVKFVPLDRIMAETDCPYVTPHPHRGQRNEPLYVREVAAKIGRLKGIEEFEMTAILLRNTKKFFPSLA